MKQVTFLFSGAQHSNLPQLDVNSSLGGYVSSTPLPKGVVNSIFAPLSNFDFANLTTDTIGIFLMNTGDEMIEELSILSIYEQIQNKEVNLCKFEFAAVIPNESGFMELIGSRKEYPLYAEFFEPKYKREEAILKFLTAGEIGDAIDILDVEISVSGNTIMSLIDDVISAFKGNADFIAEKFNDTSIYLRRKALTQTGEAIEVLTPGTATAEAVNFSGEDNSYSITEGFAPNSILGLWIRRSVIEDRISCDISQDKGKIENIELVFSF